jgi:HEAT repeat protein
MRVMETMQNRPVADLFSRAAVDLDSDDLSPSEDPTGRIAIGQLHRIASREVLDGALALCGDSDPINRQIGADVLAQLGHSRRGFEPVFVEERVAGLLGLLAAESVGSGDSRVLNAACVAFGHLRDARAVPALLDLRLHEHEDVRRSVAFGLSSYDVPEAINGLIALSTDPVDDVRDWATFGLGQLIKSDTPAIRAALRARVKDSCLDVRNEAIEGLAERGDEAALPALIGELSCGNISSGLLDAATKLATLELCEALRKAETFGLAWDDGKQRWDVTDIWRAAMHACGCSLLSTDGEQSS